MKISYAITVCNEIDEINRLYEFLRVWKKPQDEILIQQDYSNQTDEWQEVADFCRELKKKELIEYVVTPLDNNFGEFKNKLAISANGDYIFQIDADEVPNINLIQNLHTILESNPDVDVYVVPRINTVDGLTQEHIQKWRWNVNQDGWVNFPDYQWRIYRNDGTITWKNKVHEVLNGYKQFAPLPQEEEYCLYHPKTIERQVKQNNYYNTL